MYDKLYFENKGLLWFWANRYAPLCENRGDIDADDLSQIGFFALLEARETWRKDRGAWSTWASFYIRKAIREALGLRGKRQLRPVSLDVPIGEDGSDSLGDLITDENLPEADEAILQDDLVRAVREAVEAIKADLPRQAVRMVYLQGMHRTDVAKAMNVTVSTVSHLLRRGKLELRRNYRLRQALPELDKYTLFNAHKGVSAFLRDRTSTVEASVIWREENLWRFK